NLPFGEKTIRSTSLGRPKKTCRDRRAIGSHSRKDASAPAAASDLPSALKANVVTSAPWPSRAPAGLPVSASHRRTERRSANGLDGKRAVPLDVASNLPSGEKEAAKFLPSWVGSLPRGFPVSGSHRLISTGLRSVLLMTARLCPPAPNRSFC